VTAAGFAVANAAALNWAALMDRAVYLPLGMTRTSSRFSDYITRTNRATAHRKVDGRWVASTTHMPDAQAPAASATSSVNDMAKWLRLMLGNGEFAGRRVVDAVALSAAVSPQIQIAPAAAGRAAAYFGFGFNVGTTSAGRKTYSHSGAFGLGAATAFRVIPSTGVGLIALTNGYPIGVPEILSAQFSDLVEYGAIQRDYAALFGPYFAAMDAPEGSLVGVARPTMPPPSTRPLADLAGTYRNSYYGPLVVQWLNGSLTMRLGPTPLILPLEHWSGDVFTFTLDNENAAPGTISKATFAAGRVTLEYYDREHLGTFLI
jgi:hypothetical protein